MDQDIWDYFVGLRQELVTATTGIRDAGFSLYWDDTTPNHVTRSRLRSILDRRTREAAKFGVFVVTRHGDCGRRGHYRNADQYGYLTTNSYQMDIPYQDERFVWDGELFQGTRREPCPCSKKGEPVEHHVIDDIVFDKVSDLTRNKVVANVLSDLRSAIDASRDKHPRSGIREYLLRAIIQLNDVILPVGVDDHIKGRCDATASARPQRAT